MKLPLLAATLAISSLATATPLHADAAKASVPEVVTRYLEAQRSSGDLFSFCAKTRPFVAPATDYPECPPHSTLVVVDSTKTKVECNASAGTQVCVIRYRTLGHIEVGTTTFIKAAGASNATARVETRAGRQVIAEPYLLPHLDVAAVAEFWKQEEAVARERGASREYLDEVRRLRAQLAAARSEK